MPGASKHLLLPSHTACLGGTGVIQGLTFSDHVHVDILPVNVLVEPQGTNSAKKTCAAAHLVERILSEESVCCGPESILKPSDGAMVK